MKRLEIGAKVQTIFGGRIGRVVKIDTVMVIDTVDSDGTQHTHTEPQYHVQFGDLDFCNNFRIYDTTRTFTLPFILAEIARIL